MSSFNIYIALQKQQFSDGEFSIVPIRYDDRVAIMKWRNEQMYHLRQIVPLTHEKQKYYLDTVVSKLFEANSA